MRQSQIDAHTADQAAQAARAAKTAQQMQPFTSERLLTLTNQEVDNLESNAYKFHLQNPEFVKRVNELAAMVPPKPRFT